MVVVLWMKGCNFCFVQAVPAMTKLLEAQQNS